MRAGNNFTGLYTAIEIARYENIDRCTGHFPGHFLSLLNTFHIEFSRCLSLHNLRLVIHRFTMAHQI
ncbi:Uncharacterised protein [Segatella copri]|nr:Uncharacterised protein [Segatella copri]